MSQMSQIRSLYSALFKRSANIYVSKLSFDVVWLGQLHNLDTGHVYVLGLKSGLERLLVIVSLFFYLDILIRVFRHLGSFTAANCEHFNVSYSSC